MGSLRELSENSAPVTEDSVALPESLLVQLEGGKTRRKWRPQLTISWWCEQSVRLAYHRAPESFKGQSLILRPIKYQLDKATTKQEGAYSKKSVPDRRLCPCLPNHKAVLGRTTFPLFHSPSSAHNWFWAQELDDVATQETESPKQTDLNKHCGKPSRDWKAWGKPVRKRQHEASLSDRIRVSWYRQTDWLTGKKNVYSGFSNLPSTSSSQNSPLSKLEVAFVPIGRGVFSGKLF